MPADKMPKMPEAFAVICGVRHNAPKEMWGYLSEADTLRGSPEVFTADQMRAMYLAGIEAARGCVPGAFTRIDYIKNRVSDEEAAGHNTCRNLTLANLEALGME